ncbi:hypothetical protein [Pseudofulvibacter geojedonensis]|uniref:Uncharacterized protein n=1 Tax=Pseudofulvibacter geojedonensis TaxID=1123758 RepID=A0ABW3I141_9FLAO
MKHLLFFTLLLSSLIGFSQNVNYNGSLYSVKGKKIYQDKTDVTSSLSEVQQNEITKLYKERIEAIKATEKLKKDQKKNKKAKDKAEKKQNKAEKALKKKEQAQKNLEKITKKYEKEVKKYKKLSEKGKIDDEAKWGKKLKSLKEKIAKAEKKLRKA